MTDAWYDLLTSSTLWNRPTPWKDWQLANPVEADKVRTYIKAVMVGASPPLPLVTTKLGKGLLSEFSKLAGPRSIPVPPPPVPPVVTGPEGKTVFDQKGCFIVNSVSTSKAIIEAAGITAIAPQINSVGGDNSSTSSNMLDLGQWKDKVLGGWGTHAGNPQQEAAFVTRRINENSLDFYIADTEWHHLSGKPELTDTLFDELRRLLGSTFPLGCITFGYSQWSQGQAAAVNYNAMKKHNVTYIGEGYDEFGKTYGLQAVVNYMEAEGVQKPIRLGIGDKNISKDVTDLLILGKRVSGVWAWAPEQAPDLPLLSAIKL